MCRTARLVCSCPFALHLLTLPEHFFIACPRLSIAQSALQREQGLQKLVRKLQTALLSSKEEAMKARMTVIAGSPTKSSDILYPDLEAVTPSADTVPAFDSDGFS